jgi:class 3 adenylate cyclase
MEHPVDENVFFFSRQLPTLDDNALLISAGVPGSHDHHASDICKLALDILSKCATFEVKHKPNIRLKVRMGVNTGPCVTAIGTIKKPHFYIYGMAVNIAMLMEQTSEPMKIQVCAQFGPKLH